MEENKKQRKMKETAEEHGFDKKKKLLLLLLLLTFAMFVFSFATTVPRKTSEKRAHKTHNAHNTTVAQRWFFTGEILFSNFSIFGENKWIQDGFNLQN
jgi:uncharacterized ion transporter superfamily protein YfcC